MEMKVRASTVEGIFYPAEAAALSALVVELLRRSEARSGGARCIISPHAAYNFAGEVAAAAFQAAAGRTVERVVLIGPVHREPADCLNLPESEAFQTPLGSCEVDLPYLKQLAGTNPRFLFNDIPHLEEHCLEVQLPFVQTLYPRARIAPVLMGKPSPVLVATLADALRQTLAPQLDGTLIVVSANMTQSRPLEQGGRELAAALELIRAGDGEALLAAAARRSLSTCGAGCIAAILSLERHRGVQAEILKLGDSLAAGGDRRKVVHYAAIAFGSADHGADADIRGTRDPAAGGQGDD
jgi:AmmeMemoRadiSam system protein B